MRALCDVAVAQAGLLGMQPRLVLVQVVVRAEPSTAEFAVDLKLHRWFYSDYRVTKQLVPKVVLTSKQKLGFRIKSIY